MALREALKSQGDYLFKYRSYFPLILLLAGVAMIVFGALRGGLDTFCGYQAWMEKAAIFVSLLGLAIRAHAVGFSARATSGRNTGEGQIADMLNTKGLYSIMRNPLYLGNYFMWLGIAMLTDNCWFILIFSLIFWIYYERIVFAEEEFLRAKFGDTYLNWAEKTPIFIPRLMKWQKPDSGFQWKKVMKQEKNGLLALFLVFFILDTLGRGIESGEWIPGLSWLPVMLVFSILFYIAIKLLKRFTSF